MRRQLRKKIPKKFTSKMQTKLLFVFFVVLLLMTVLIGRLIMINHKDGERWEKKVLSQKSYVSSPIPYRRGSITDRNGVVLARSDKVYNVILDAKILLIDEENVEVTVNALCEVFSLDPVEVNQKLREKSTSSYVVLVKEQSYELITEFTERAKKNKKIKAVWFEEDYKRIYPYDSLASNLLGYTNSGNVGTWGIEQFYSTILNGVNGRTYGYYDQELNLQRTVKKARNGNTLVSTIDVNVQGIVEKKVCEFMDSIGCENIGVILMDPNNGEILSMVSNRGFDLNNPFDLKNNYSETEIDAMDEETRLDALNKMWRNFCISDTFEPGSTFKPITIAAALEEDLVKKNSTYSCTGMMKVGGWDITCNNKGGHGKVTLAEALTKSCNPALMTIGEVMGRDTFYRYQKHFGLGSPTGIDLPGEANGILLALGKLNETELATSSFGQSFNITMVQIAAAYASLINGGSYYQPHVVKEILNDNGATVESKEPVLVKETISQDTSDFIKEAGYLTVETGTAKAAKVEGYMIGGKTGTAQKYPRDAKKYVVSFIGSVPADQPRLLIYVAIDEIHDEEKKASSTAATELASSILGEVLPFLEIYPEGEIDYHIDLPTNLPDTNTATPGTDPDNKQEPSEGEGSNTQTPTYDPTQDEGNPDAIPE